YDPASKAMANRNTTYLGIVGFLNAYLLTGDDRYLDVWRRQVDAVNANKKVVDGQTLYPRMFGDKGWYDFSPQKYEQGLPEIAYLSQKPEDFARLPQSGWRAWLAGGNAGYPEAVLRGDLERLRQRVQGMRNDPTTPDTRLSDDPMAFNPASVQSLIELMLGGIHPGHRGAVLHSALRYFDPDQRRPGIPEDVAALVSALDGERVTVTLVNVNQLASRRVILQAGAYAEHRFTSVTLAGNTTSLDSPRVEVTLSPGSGATLAFTHRRHVNVPTMALPWDVDREPGSAP
ncbi:MAG: hypothetical protein ACKV0T_20290, partial [Planctomycetales bacterium]